MSAAKIHFHASDGPRLEGLWQAPESAAPCPVAVLAHSHSLQPGGHMHTQLQRALSAALLAHGFAVLRFNFRGVQESEGVFDDGRGELHDLRGAVDYALRQTEVDPARLVLCGYSFGSRVVMPYAPGDPRVRAVAALGFPARRFVQTTLDLRVPALLLVGDGDTVTPPHNIELFHARHPGATLNVMASANHHFRGLETQAAETVALFLLAHLP